MDMEAVRSAPTTRIELVMSTISQRIGSRSLTAGARLPSVRALARSLQVSVSTVVEAYGRLVAEGAIVSRAGSGFYVANQVAPMSLASAGPKADRAIDPLWVSRQSLETQDSLPKPGCGWLPSSWLPQQSLRRAARGLSRAGADALCGYGSPLGLPPLRQLISRRLGERGVEAAPDQIMLTESGTQAINLLCRYLLETGAAGLDPVGGDGPDVFEGLTGLIDKSLLRQLELPDGGITMMPRDRRSPTSTPPSLKVRPRPIRSRLVSFWTPWRRQADRLHTRDLADAVVVTAQPWRFVVGPRRRSHEPT